MQNIAQALSTKYTYSMQFSYMERYSLSFDEKTKLLWEKEVAKINSWQVAKYSLKCFTQSEKIEVIESTLAESPE